MTPMQDNFLGLFWLFQTRFGASFHSFNVGRYGKQSVSVLEYSARGTIQKLLLELFVDLALWIFGIAVVYVNIQCVSPWPFFDRMFVWSTNRTCWTLKQDCEGERERIRVYTTVLDARHIATNTPTDLGRIHAYSRIRAWANCPNKAAFGICLNAYVKCI